MSVSRAFTAGRRDRDIVITRRDGKRQVLRESGNDPYQTMVEHFAQAVRYGTPLWRTPDQSVRLLALMDELRQAAQHHTP